jgi:hydrogenase nickel incorporation protein HypA/HybF
MHEMSIAKNLVKITSEACRKNNIKKARTIKIKVGELKAIVPSLLADAFKFAAKGTVCEGAKLKVKALPVKFACIDCNIPVKQSKKIKCGKCGKNNVKLAQGNEFIIESVEGE